MLAFKNSFFLSQCDQKPPKTKGAGGGIVFLFFVNEIIRYNQRAMYIVGFFFFFFYYEHTLCYKAVAKEKEAGNYGFSQIWGSFFQDIKILSH